MSLFDYAPRLQRVTNDSQFNEAVSAAAKDGHGLVGLTHTVVKGGEVVGAFNIGGLPLVSMWLSEAVSPRESFHLINAVENVCAGQGVKQGLVAVSPDSPFAPVMERLGYENMGTCVLWRRRV
jgi:hypothetical protein